MTKQVVFVACLAVLVGPAFPAHSQTPGAWIEPKQVASALSSHAFAVSPAQVQLPVSVPSRRVAPDLEVLSLETTDGHNTKVKLRCRNGVECLPFYAVVHWNSREESERAVGLSPKPTAQLPTIPAQLHDPWFVRAGEAATLVLEGAHVRIQLPVICLGSGSVGKNIRVITTDRRKTYRAEVVATGVLKGGL